MIHIQFLHFIKKKKKILTRSFYNLSCVLKMNVYEIPNEKYFSIRSGVGREGTYTAHDLNKLKSDKIFRLEMFYI